MSLHERNPAHFDGNDFSRWHRATLGDNAGMIDIDYVDYCDKCGETLLLTEITHQSASITKPTTVIRKLALRARVPGWLVYVESSAGAVQRFHVQQVAPTRSELVTVAPEKLEQRIIRLRSSHHCPDTTAQEKRELPRSWTDVLPTAQQARDYAMTGTFTPDRDGWMT